MIANLAKFLGFLTLAWFTTAASASTPFTDLKSSYHGNDQLSDSPEVKAFLDKEGGDRLNDAFPYRMNIFTQGTTTKNAAGVRVSEEASQIKANDFGQIFYYELEPKGMRVPHWHANGNEIGVVMSSKMRVEIWEPSGKPSIYYVEPGQTWFIPKGHLHVLENVGGEQLKFLVVYDQPVTADRDFVTAWGSLPTQVLAKVLGLNEADISQLQLDTRNRLSSFEPTVPLEPANDPNGYKSDLSQIKPLFQSALGSIIRLDQSTNANFKNLALQRTVLKPGAMRVPHWYISGDVLLYVNSGIGYFTMMTDSGTAYNRLVRRGDLISIPVGEFNGFINVGKSDLEVYEAFYNLGDLGEISLLNGSKQLNIDILRGTTGITDATARKILAQPPQDMIMPFFK
jgi:oxalate decarboxylase/phosphoglucose isomerase-like protein (cupin superfamily)